MAKSDGVVGSVLHPAADNTTANARSPPDCLTEHIGTSRKMIGPLPASGRGGAQHAHATTAAPVSYGCEPAAVYLCPPIYPGGTMTASFVGPDGQSRMARRIGMLLAVAV